MQPAISAELKARKVRRWRLFRPQVIATGNIGCMMQIGRATERAGGAYCRTARLGHRRAEAATAFRDCFDSGMTGAILLP
jgi:Fe-S oxidoreductase